MSSEKDQCGERRESGVKSREAGVEGGVSSENLGGGGCAWDGGIDERGIESAVGGERSGGGRSSRVDAREVRRVPAENSVAR
jgi:hypothetical protein